MFLWLNSIIVIHANLANTIEQPKTKLCCLVLIKKAASKVTEYLNREALHASDCQSPGRGLLL